MLVTFPENPSMLPSAGGRSPEDSARRGFAGNGNQVCLHGCAYVRAEPDYVLECHVIVHVPGNILAYWVCHIREY